MVVFLVSFLIVFVLMLFAVSIGMKYLEAKRKKHVKGMLQTAAGEPVVSITSRLKEIEPDESQGLKGFIRSLEFSRHAKAQLLQAGLTWTPTKLLGMMGGMAAAGILLGCLFPVAVNIPTSAIVFGGAMGFLPYLFVRKKRNKRLDTMEEQFPEALDFLARSMRAGHAFTVSLEMAGEELPDPLGQEFR